MKKCKFYKLCVGEYPNPVAVLTDGFCETLIDDYGNEIIVCFDKRGKHCWDTTEKSTGLGICSDITKKDTLNQVKSYYLPHVWNSLQAKKNKKYKEIIAEAYRISDAIENLF